MSDITYVLYHADCFDGFGAAWGARAAIPDAVLLPVKYGTAPPGLEPYSKVYIVDFSYSRDQLEVMHGMYDLTVIDHHKTAMDALKGLRYALFDMDHSGAILTWRYFHPGEAAPTLLMYIEDRDLWSFKLPYSHEIHAWLSSHPRNFEIWDNLITEFEPPSRNSKEVVEGTAILRYKKQKIDEICANVYLMDLGGFPDIPHTNCSYNFASETANELLDRFPTAPFAAAWFKRADGKLQYSLRSRKDFDCSTVAKGFGGGGHPQASGFEK